MSNISFNQFNSSSSNLELSNNQNSNFIKIPSKDGLPSYQIFNSPIITSDNDNRTYRLIKLNNHLNAIIIHDPKTDKSAAAMDVNVGHLSDPPHLQGLAHFCEHLLFMGNQKYPSENDYSEYLAKNSGHSNAFTGLDNTVYFFDVHPSALDGALDRFSQFFISPIFSDSCTEREIRVVDSENSKNLQSDVWRIFQLDKATSSPSHSFWKFGTGNLQTLWDRPRANGLDIRKELLKFYASHYSSNVMNLAVLGKESLDDLTHLVVQKFSPVPNNHIQPDRFDGSPYTNLELNKIIYAQMIKDTNLLEITFPLPDQDPYYDTQPLGFISHYIGHEGLGSIASHLKKMGWINTLQSGSSGGATGFELLKITLDLTVDGLINYQQVLKIIFAYLDLLRATPPQEWAFKEQVLLSKTRFKFKSPTSPSSYVTSLASWLRRPCPREKIISSVYLAEKFDDKLIQENLQFLHPQNCRILVGTQNPLDGINYNLKEEWYGTKYTIKDLPINFLHSETPFDFLALPPPNSFISTNFQVDKLQDIIKPTRRPNCLIDNSFNRIWHKKDDRWWLPRAMVIMMIRNPITNSTCMNSLKTHFITKLLKDDLNEQLYEAEIAGLNYDIHTSWDSIIFNVDGYNQKLHLLLETILKRLKELKVDELRFKIVKDEAERRWKNFVLEGPYSHASYWTDSILSHIHYSYEEKLQLLKDLTPQDIQAFIPQVLSHGFVETLVHGNLTEKDAKDLSKLPNHIFQFDKVDTDDLKPALSLIIPEGSNYVYKRPLANSSNVNSAVDYYIHVGDLANHDYRTKTSLLSHLMHESFFNQLRTKEQLGYIVQSYRRLVPGQCGLKFMIQSERDPNYVEGRIENFLNWFLHEKLKVIEDEEFEEMKMSLVHKALEDFKNMWDESSHYWMFINSGYYAFGQKEKDAEIIKGITKAELIEFYEKFIDPSSPTRAKCSTRIQSQHVPVSPSIVVKALSKIQKGDNGIEDVKIPVIIEEHIQALQSLKPDLDQIRAYLTQQQNAQPALPDQTKLFMKNLIQQIENEMREEEKEQSELVSNLLASKPQLIETKESLKLLKEKFKLGPKPTPLEDWN